MKSLLLIFVFIIATYAQKGSGGGGGGGKGGDLTPQDVDSVVDSDVDSVVDIVTTEEETTTPRPTKDSGGHEEEPPTDEPTPKPTADSGTGTYSVSANPTATPTTPPPTWPVDATTEECPLVSYTTKTCGCGTMCSSYTREYFAVCPKKCGEQILRTGEFGKEKCDLNDFFAKDMSKNYTLVVLPCEDGEFAFSDNATKLSIGFWTIAICIYLYFCTLN